MCDATQALVGALLSPSLPLQAAALWSGALDPPPIERHAQREARAAEALQAVIEASSASRAAELAEARERAEEEAREEAYTMEAYADACVEAVDHASDLAAAAREEARRDAREVEDARRELGRMCAPAPFRAWAPRIRAVLDEEREEARSALRAKAEARCEEARARRHASPPPLSRRTSSPSDSSAHLRTFVDASSRRREAEAVERMQAAAARAIPLLASCVLCRGPNARCETCISQPCVRTPPSPSDWGGGGGEAGRAGGGG